MKGNSQFKLPALVFFFMTLMGLVVYSYSQIDLNLTLSSNSLYQKIQQQLILLGYFNRPLSTAIYLVILLLLFSFYIFFLYKARRRELTEKRVWRLAVVSAIILIFSYPAFSHDIFNYIFDTRLLITHRVNPWEFTALDFPQDLWTRFMRWTHRTYPYGPAWIAMTIPFYIAGLGKFTLTLLWFKVLGAISYLMSVKLIKKILVRVTSDHVAVGMTLYALNPLILIESLVSSHIDSTMTVIFLAAIFIFTIESKKYLSWMLLILSSGIKFITATTIPVFLWWKGEKKHFEKAMILTLLLILLATALEIVIRETLPWYFITPLAVIGLLPKKKDLTILAISGSAGLLLRYTPFLLRGEYSLWVKSSRNILTIIPLLGALVFIAWKRKQRLLQFFS